MTATLSGTMTATLQWETDTYLVEAEWVDVPVAE